MESKRWDKIDMHGEIMISDMDRRISKEKKDIYRVMTNPNPHLTSMNYVNL